VKDLAKCLVEIERKTIVKSQTGVTSKQLELITCDQEDKDPEGENKVKVSEIEKVKNRSKMWMELDSNGKIKSEKRAGKTKPKKTKKKETIH